MIMKNLRITALSIVVLGGVLASCAPDRMWMAESSTVMDQPMQIVESRHVTKKPLAELSDADIANAAHAYKKGGAGPMYVVVAFKDHGKIPDSAIASQKARIESQLQGAGIAAADITSSMVPLETDQPVALIAFDTLEATGPAGCTTPMPGYSTNAEEANMTAYKTGCGVKNLMARQIADPRDLEGVAGLSPATNGDHLADVIQGQYRPGAEPRPFLPSYLISELAGSGGQ